MNAKATSLDTDLETSSATEDDSSDIDMSNAHLYSRDGNVPAHILGVGGSYEQCGRSFDRSIEDVSLLRETGQVSVCVHLSKPSTYPVCSRSSTSACESPRASLSARDSFSAVKPSGSLPARGVVSLYGYARPAWVSVDVEDAKLALVLVSALALPDDMSDRRIVGSQKVMSR